MVFLILFVIVLLVWCVHVSFSLVAKDIPAACKCGNACQSYLTSGPQIRVRNRHYFSYFSTKTYVVGILNQDSR